MGLEDGVEGLPLAFEGGECPGFDELACSGIAVIIGFFVDPETVGAHEAVVVCGDVEFT